MSSGVLTVPNVPRPGPRGLPPPTREDIGRELRRQKPGIKIYNPSQEWVSFQFAGVTYRIPPDVGGGQVRHPGTDELVVGNGELEIKDRYGLDHGIERVFEIDHDIVVFACKTLASEGVTWLTGKPEVDEARKSAARKIHYQFLRSWADAELQGRREFLEHWKKDESRRGLTPPGPTARQIRAQEFLDAMRINATERERAYVCPCGMWEGDDFAGYARHRLGAHGEKVTPTVDDTVDPAGARRAEAARRVAASTPDDVDGPAPVAPLPQDIAATVVAQSMAGVTEEHVAALDATVEAQRRAREAKQQKKGRGK
jgi:hypothetical protein